MKINFNNLKSKQKLCKKWKTLSDHEIMTFYMSFYPKRLSETEWIESSSTFFVWTNWLGLVCAWIHGASKHTQSLHWLLGKTNKSFQVFETGNKERKNEDKGREQIQWQRKELLLLFPPLCFLNCCFATIIPNNILRIWFESEVFGTTHRILTLAASWVLSFFLHHI